jgi:hypothetical protein
MSAFGFTLLLAQAYPLGTGKIQGGWEYVWAAYLISLLAIALYALSLWLRRRAEAHNGLAQSDRTGPNPMAPVAKREAS